MEAALIKQIGFFIIELCLLIMFSFWTNKLYRHLKTTKQQKYKMNNNLKNELYDYLGSLLHQHQNTFDWIEKDEITEKINAVHVLLGIEVEEKTWYQKVAEQLKAIK